MRATQVDPAFRRARVNLCEAYEHKGMHAEAEAEYRKLAGQEGAPSVTVNSLFREGGACGERGAGGLFGRRCERGEVSHLAPGARVGLAVEV